jgi:hypothetical protein
MAGHFTHGDRVTCDQADQTVLGLMRRPRIESQYAVEVQLPELHEPGAALRLLDDVTSLAALRVRGPTYAIRLIPEVTALGQA